MCSNPTYMKKRILLLATAAMFVQAWAQTPPPQKWLDNTQGTAAGSGVRSGDVDIPRTVTVEAVVRFNVAPTGNVSIVSKHSTNDAANANYVLRPDRFEFVTRVGTTNTLRTVINPCTLEVNKCYHLAGVYDGQRAYFYVNGCLVNSIEATGDLLQNNVNVGIGYRSNNAERFRGFIDQARVWNVARTQVQIRDNMYANLSTPQTGLALYFHFDNYVSGNTVNNLAGGPASYNGTRVGSAAIVDQNLCTNFERPEFTMTAPNVLCGGETLNLSVSPILSDAAYQWLGPNGFSASGPNIAINNFMQSQGGEYSCVVSRSCCAETLTTFVGACPALEAVSSRQNMCAGQTSMLSVLNPTAFKNYVWEPSASLNTINGHTVFASPQQTTTYTVTGYTLDGCVCSATVTVVIGDGSASLNVSRSEVCADDTVSIIGTGNITAWFRNGVFFQPPPNHTLVDALYETTTYRIRGIDAIGCAFDITRTVNVIPRLEVAVSAPPATCISAPVTLSVQNPIPGVNYYWMPGNEFGPTIVVNPALSTIYTVVATAETGYCPTMVEAPVVRGPIPFGLNVSDTVTICAGESLTLFVPDAPNGAQYQWSPSVHLNMDFGPSVVATPPTDITYSVTGFLPGCEPVTRTVRVRVTRNAPVSVSTTAAFVCLGGSAILTASGADEYVWSTGQIGQTIDVYPTQTTTYTVTGYAEGLCEATAETTIVVNPLPDVQVTAQFSQICLGQSLQLQFSGAEYYYVSPGDVFTNASNFMVQPGQTTTYTVVGTTPGGCVDVAYYVLGVVPNPGNSLTVTGNTTVCVGGMTTLTASGALTYVWEPGYRIGAELLVQDLDQTTTFTVYGYDDVNGGCSAIRTVTVSVVEPHDVAIVGDDFVCDGSSTTLRARAYRDGVDLAPNTLTYLWNTGLTTETIDALEAGTYEVLVTDVYGCVVGAAHNIYVPERPTVSVPATRICRTSPPMAIDYSPPGGFTAVNGIPTSFVNAQAIEVGINTVSYTYTTPEGCVYTAVTEIEVVPNTLSGFATPNSTTCAACNDAWVRLTAVGGEGPFQYSLDGVNFQDGRLFYNLSPGSYVGTIRDAIGCTRTVNFRINSCTLPRNFSFETLTASSVRVSWESESQGAPYSLRYRRFGTTTWYIVNNITTASHVIDNLVLGQSYEYYVTTSCGNASAIGTYVHSLPSCPAPSNVSTVVSSNNTLYVSWTGTQSANMYYIAWTAAGQPVDWTTAVSTTQNNVVLTLPAGEGAYEIYLRAQCGDEWSIYTVRTITVQSCPVAQNATLQCSGERLRAAWTNTQTIPSSWTVSWRKNEAGAVWTSAVVTGTTLEYLLPAGLEFGATYQFRVQSRCGDVTGDFSAVASAVNNCGEPTSACPNAANVQVGCVNGQYVATWTNVPFGQQPEFWTPMWRLNEPGAAWVNGTISGIFNSFVLPNDLLSGRNYQFRIRSRCGTTINLPTTPVNFFTSCAAGRWAENNQSLEDEFVVYPNPTDGEIQIRFTAPEGRAAVTVHDLSGKIVAQFERETLSGRNVFNFALPETAKGIYVLSLQTKDRTRRVKLTVL